ncbi:MAG TPA: efflux RND transporter periplasmic adaptor subunit [Thermoanaerobaculales bacterium]|nr:efflux RND transporter periplasmic adaptor subunit [Thermoanaerobaculales bacterium]HPA82699.1 efflux RND transporter periplasmic adaptor subunit [Thermoanaerobaculales bacterium]HQL29351.1 efflux RND transporter periplasmic adaptor subunit [Thermoanaerobaculales bacterium]HQN97523.1 efflux RND transporter periplasmic adaptor subunit [Thermoanaerobaculales bacterium]HQP43061.1 efflux RND transporter periplasmic adaptor subunit [Thermoanaerobaculales bacterium]
MSSHSILRALAVLALTLAWAACGRGESQAPGAAAQAPPVEQALAGRGAAAGVEHEAEPEEPSDLDRPVDELFRAACEHGRQTFACDECRWEVGVVRVPASLVDGGLVETAGVGRRAIAVPLTLTGEVRFDERRVAHCSSQVEGIIRAVHVAPGDMVRRGQPLLEIESVVVGEAQAAYLEARGLLDIARRNFERVSALKQEAIASEKEYLQARQELEAAEIRSEGALGTLSRLGAGAGEAGPNAGGNARGRFVLRAPASGTVLTMHAVPGEVARTEESLVTVGDSSTVWVWADLYERDIAAVSRAHAAQPLAAAVAVKAYPGEQFPGVVDLISPAMDESSRTVKVRVAVANPDRRLLAGMFASVEVFLPGSQEVLAVPREALLEDEGRSFVFVHHHDDYFVRRPVEAGRTWDRWIEVTSGLEAGQTVVAEGAFLLKSDVLRSKMGAGCAD